MAIIRMPLRACPKFDFPKSLPNILILVKSYAMRKRRCVLRVLFAQLRSNFLIKLFDFLNRMMHVIREPSFFYLRRDIVSMDNRKKLALLCMHAMPMQIAICSRVQNYLKSHKSIFERSPDFLPPLSPAFEIF